MKKLILFLLFFLSSAVFSQNTYVISLDGAESFGVNDDASNNLDLTGSYTFECWISVDSYQEYDRIFDRRTVCELSLYAPVSSGFRLRFTERGSSDNILRSLVTTNDFSLDTWYHIAVTFDGSTARLYVNNSLEASEVNTNWSLAASTNALNIGGLYYSSYSNQIDALIDEFRVSNTARAIGDMQTTTSASPYTSDANTVLLMHLDDQGDPPTYISGTGLTGSTFDDDITSIDYVTDSSLPLPVELTSFSAKVSKGEVTLNWETVTEVENYGFEIERQVGSKQSTVGNWDMIGFVEGHGNSNSPKEYSFEDTLTHTLNLSLTPTLYYRLKQIDNDGSFSYSNVVEVIAGEIPDGFVLEQNYPNPFNPSTTIKFAIAETQEAELIIYDVLGTKLEKLFSGNAEGGKLYEIEFNAADYPSGIYFYSLRTQSNQTTKKMILLR